MKTSSPTELLALRRHRGRRGEPIARVLAGAMRQEAIQRWWSNNVNYLANDFRTYVDRLSTEYVDEVWVPERLSEI